MSTLQELKALPVWELARMCDGISDNVKTGGPAGVFLADVRDAWAEYVESEGSADRDTIERDVLSSVVDALGTWNSWEIFTDCGAWQVEPYDSESPWGSDGDLSGVALAVLGKVASDLLSSLSGELDEEEEDEEEAYRPDTYRDRIDGHDYVITYMRDAPQVHAADCEKCGGPN